MVELVPWLAVASFLTVFVVGVDVFGEQVLEMPFVHRNDMIQ
jgi:hypothetical protein